MKYKYKYKYKIYNSFKINNNYTTSKFNKIKYEL
jgi:hypothetical protein